MNTKVVKICGMYCVLLDSPRHGPYGTWKLDSFTVIRLEDDGLTHYAQYKGPNHGSDYLPGGPLYLGDTWDAAINALGIDEEVERQDDCP